MNSFLKNSLILCFFAALTVYFTWPLIGNMDCVLLTGAESDDASVSTWNVYLFKSSLQNRTSPFWTNSIFAPLGADLTMHLGMPAMSMFCLPFSNDLLGFNIYLFLQFTISGFGAYLLAYRLTKHSWGSLIVGMIYAFSAFKMARLNGHYMLAFGASVPFYLICFFKAFEFEVGKFIPRIVSWKYVAYCFLLGIFTALNDYYSTFYLIYFSIFWALYYKLIVYWKAWNWKKRLIILTGLFTAFHLILQVLRISGLDNKGAYYWGGDLLSFFIPNHSTF